MSRTKQETLLLEERIEKIRKRNEELKRRHLVSPIIPQIDCPFLLFRVNSVNSSSLSVNCNVCAHCPFPFVWLFLMCVLHVAVFIEECDINFIIEHSVIYFCRECPMIAYHQPTHVAFYC
jgi:hypothetical protein